MTKYARQSRKRKLYGFPLDLLIKNKAQKV